MKLCVVLIAWCLVAATKASQDKRIDKLEFSAVTREIDLTSNLVKEKTTIVVENKDQKSISWFLYTIPRSAADKLAYIGGQVIDRMRILFLLMLTSIVLYCGNYMQIVSFVYYKFAGNYE
jgi:hypothetical protein